MSIIVPVIDPLVLLLLTVLAFGVEKHYIGRLTVAANAVILWTTFGSYFFIIGEVFVLWVVVSTIAAIVAVASYLNAFAIPVHDIFFIFYSSKTVLGVLLATTIGLLDYSLIFVIAIWAVSIYFLGHRIPFVSN